MEEASALSRLTDQPALDAIAGPLSQAVRGIYEAAGPAGRQAKNLLHGVWLRHPLHPVFTDLPLGAWTTGLVLDAAAAVNGDRRMEEAADIAIAVGLAGAAGAAVTGLTDWSETSGRARRTGLIHGLMNIAATTLYATAFVLRRNGSRASGQACALAGFSIAGGAAWLGGDLVYDQRIGVMHAAVEQPEEFADVAAGADVADGSMARAHTDHADVLLVRQRGRLCALAHPCSHLGGPLSEGTLKDGSVVCPWHGSEFSIDDGAVINGPATQNQPVLAARERDGRIEVKER
jgi:nitrite reductase/ring-hydroxylating ferredoxin subunit